MNKLRLHEKLLIGFFVALFACLIVCVVKQRMLDSNEPLTVDSFEPSATAYDVSVVNQATCEDFLNVKGIGAAKATAIVEFREALGGFDSVYQIGDLTAISDKLLDAIIEYFYESNVELSETTQETDLLLSAESEVVTTSIEPLTEPIVTTAPETTTVPATTTAEPTTQVTTTTQTATTKVTTTATTTVPATTTTEPVTTTSDDPDEEIIDDELNEVEIVNSVPAMQPVEINYADAQTIADCLLIDLDIAEEIVSIRNRIGRYTYAHELVLCKSIDSNMAIYERIKDFVIIS